MPTTAATTAVQSADGSVTPTTVSAPVINITSQAIFGSNAFTSSNSVSMRRFNSSAPEFCTSSSTEPCKHPKRRRLNRSALDESHENIDSACPEEELELPESNAEQDFAWYCPINGCSAKVKFLKNRKRHLLDYHGSRCMDGRFGRNRVKCLICGKVVLNKSNLNTHHQLKHEKLKQKSKPIKQYSSDRMKWE